MPDIGHVIIAALIFGLLLGILSVLTALVVYFRYQKLGANGAILLLIGVVLLGLSFWQSFELSASTSGELVLKAESSLYQAVNASRESIETLRTTEEKLSDTCPNLEASAQELQETIRLQEHEYRQLVELQSNLSKALHDMSMTPIRELR